MSSTHVKVHVSKVIDAPVARVWGLLRDFNGLPSFHPFFTVSAIEGGLPADAVGCVRNFRNTAGDLIRERLLTLCDRTFQQVYTIIEVENLAVRDYVAGFRLHPVTEGDQTFAEWSAEFDCAPADAANLHTQIASVFQTAFDQAQARLGRR
jgi:hypothetical protein